VAPPPEAPRREPPASITVVSTQPHHWRGRLRRIGGQQGLRPRRQGDQQPEVPRANTTLTLSKVDTKSTPATGRPGDHDGDRRQVGQRDLRIGLQQRGRRAVAARPEVGLPIIYTQAGSDGVVIGDYTYRATPLMREYYPIIKKFIQDKGYKSVGIVYTQATPTLQNIGSQTVPAIAKELG
jgi:hypothetical protein